MRKLLLGLFLSAVWSCAAAVVPGQFSISDTVVKVPIAGGVSMDDAVESMKLRANVLNIKLVAHQPMHKELQAMGVPSRRVEIFQFCDAGIGWEMIQFRMDFVAYMPCRIALVEDEAGKGWLVMVNMDFFVGAADLPPALKARAEKLRDGLNEILHAGASGEL
jgi:uncharacterized protein (DUF302 family)